MRALRSRTVTSSSDENKQDDNNSQVNNRRTRRRNRKSSENDETININEKEEGNNKNNDTSLTETSKNTNNEKRKKTRKYSENKPISVKSKKDDVSSNTSLTDNETNDQIFTTKNKSFRKRRTRYSDMKISKCKDTDNDEKSEYKTKGKKSYIKDETMDLDKEILPMEDFLNLSSDDNEKKNRRGTFTVKNEKSCNDDYVEIEDSLSEEISPDKTFEVNNSSNEKSSKKFQIVNNSGEWIIEDLSQDVTTSDKNENKITLHSKPNENSVSKNDINELDETFDASKTPRRKWVKFSKTSTTASPLLRNVTFSELESIKPVLSSSPKERTYPVTPYVTPSKRSFLKKSTEKKTDSKIINKSVILINSSTKKKSAVKSVPNFSEIHKKAFEKMENIQEYSERKKERAKILISGGKFENTKENKKEHKNVVKSSQDLFGTIRAQMNLVFADNIDTNKTSSILKEKTPKTNSTLKLNNTNTKKTPSVLKEKTPKTNSTLTLYNTKKTPSILKEKMSKTNLILDLKTTKKDVTFNLKTPNASTNTSVFKSKTPRFSTPLPNSKTNIPILKTRKINVLEQPKIFQDNKSLFKNKTQKIIQKNKFITNNITELIKMSNLNGSTKKSEKENLPTKLPKKEIKNPVVSTSRIQKPVSVFLKTDAIALANKTKASDKLAHRTNHRNHIKGVRTNRRFELLMQARNNS